MSRIVQVMIATLYFMFRIPEVTMVTTHVYFMCSAGSHGKYPSCYFIRYTVTVVTTHNLALNIMLPVHMQG